MPEAKLSNSPSYIDRLALISASGKFTWFGASMMVLAFILPLYKKAVPLAVVLVILARVIEQFSAPDHFKKGNSALQKGVALMTGFYALHLIGMLWSNNWDYGSLDLQYKLSLVVFPLLFFPRVTKDILLWKRAANLYLIGYFLFIGISITNASLGYWEDGNLSHFFYMELSMWFHPSYQAMYGAWAILLVISFASDGFKTKHALAIVVLCFYLSLLASKAGFISGFIAIGVGLIVMLKSEMKRSKAALIGLTAMLVLAAFIVLSPQSRGRIQSAVNFVDAESEEEIVKEVDSAESNAARTIVWKFAFQEFMKHPFGVGTGDVKDHLTAVYEANGANEAAKIRMNPHNQYLQSAVALGWLGLLFSLLIIVVPLWYLLKSKRWVHAGFFLIFGFNLLVESMIEVQSGVVFFAFWAMLLLNDAEVPRPKMPFHNA